MELNAEKLIVALLSVAALYSRVRFFYRELVVDPKRHPVFGLIEATKSYVLRGTVRSSDQFKFWATYDYNYVIVDELDNLAIALSSRIEVSYGVWIFRFKIKLPLYLVSAKVYRNRHNSTVTRFAGNIRKRHRDMRIPERVMDKYDLERVDSDNIFINSLREELGIRFLGNRTRAYSMLSLCRVYLQTLKDLVIPAQLLANGEFDSLSYKGYVHHSEKSVQAPVESFWLLDTEGRYLIFNDVHAASFSGIAGSLPQQGMSFLVLCATVAGLYEKMQRAFNGAMAGMAGTCYHHHGVYKYQVWCRPVISEGKVQYVVFSSKKNYDGWKREKK